MSSSEAQSPLNQVFYDYPVHEQSDKGSMFGSSDEDLNYEQSEKDKQSDHSESDKEQSQIVQEDSQEEESQIVERDDIKGALERLEIEKKKREDLDLKKKAEA